MSKVSKIPKVVYFLIIGVLASGIFYILKSANFIDNLWSSQNSKDGKLLTGFTSRPTPSVSNANTNNVAEVRATSTQTSFLPQSKTTFLSNVPFTPQAPFGNWDDIRQQAGCEEAAALMAMRWVNGQSLTLREAEKEIIAISDFELKNYGHFHDASAQDTVDRIFKGYFGYNNVEVKYDIDADDIKNELSKGNLVLVPANGQKLNNPFYKPPGPLEHMLVIRGYDVNTKEFITNDSGTKRGELFRYDENLVVDAVYDYPTGFHEQINGVKKVMIVVKPKA